MEHALTNQLIQPLTLFHKLYGPGEVTAWRAPARINILGEHIDYVSYLPTASLPFASHEHEMVMLYRANDSGVVRGASVNEKFAPFSFAVQEGLAKQNQTWLDYLYRQSQPPPHWSNYVKGAVFFAQQQARLLSARGFDFVIASGIPPQGGSSSSSALVVLAGVAFREVNELAFTAAQLAQDSAQAEWYVGTRGGALDHTTICLAARQHAVHLRYADKQAELIPLPDDGLRWVTFFSHAADKGREVLLAYNERAAVSRLLLPAVLARHFAHEWEQALQSHDAIATVLTKLPETILLAEIRRDYPEVYQQCLLAFPALVQERSQHLLKLRPRAFHHWGEVQRVQQAVKLLRHVGQSQATMLALGKLLNQSHASLRDLYEVSTPQVDQLYAIIRTAPQVFGARLIGGGFGGNILALTTTENVAAMIQHVQATFYTPQNRQALAEGAIMVSTPGQGITKLA